MEKNFQFPEDCIKYLKEFFVQKKKKKIWEDGIMKLPERWHKVVWNKTVNTMSKKKLVKMKNESIFTLKPNELFRQPYIILRAYNGQQTFPKMITCEFS